MKTQAIQLVENIPSQHRKLLSVYITFAVFFIANVIMDPTILTSYSRLWPLSLQFAPLMLCAMSQSSVMLIGGINLAIGTSLSLMTAVAAVTMGEGPLGISRGILLTLVCGMAVGLVMGTVVVLGRLPDIIVTLSFSYIWKGIALWLLPVPGGHIAPAYTAFMNGKSIVPSGILIVVISLIIWKLFKKTKTGLGLYAVGGNAKSAFESGINVKKTRIISYVVSGFFLAVAGLILVGQTGSGDPNIGISYQMNCIAAAVLGGVSFSGGVGQMKGAVLGAFIFTSLVNILFFSGISPFYQYIVQGLILIVAIGLKAVSYYRKGGDRA
ncbi:ABC transporter permease [Oscillospiraceae bacterium PP1C4]